ncbi:hypothetical protein OAB00_00150 [Akkermansiaceae bacterium]|nr:hypothetical protein [Akkermansiaceae bacterium]
MKIYFDKTQSLPAHTLTVQKLKLAVSLLPKDMKSLINYIHVGNQLPSDSRFDRPVILASKRLNVLDRGLSEYQIIREIFIELAQNLDRMESGHLGAYYGNRLNPSQLKQLNDMAEPFMKAYKELAFII